MRRHRSTRRSIGLLLTLLLPVALVACGEDDETTASTTTSPTGSSTTTSTAPDEESEVRAYFLRDENVGPVARAASGAAVAAAAMEGLLAGPTSEEQEIGFSTAIPAGTTLNGVEIDGGLATVDLSSEFTTDGGSASMQGRVAEVVFTLTQFDTVDAVSFEVDGEPLTVLGGEGLMLDEPQDRNDWEDLSPAILVESPLPFADVSSPLQITGTGNTFEAAFIINITDGEGLIVYDEPAMATSGTGTRGTFDVTATLDDPRPGLGTVIVFEESAEDGSHINIVEIPVNIR